MVASSKLRPGLLFWKLEVFDWGMPSHQHLQAQMALGKRLS